MSHKNFCDEHEELKTCTKGVITWPKFIGILITVIVAIIGVTTTVSSFLYGAAGKAELRAEEVDKASISRDNAIVQTLKDEMNMYIIPMGKDIAAIKEKVGAR